MVALTKFQAAATVVRRRRPCDKAPQIHGAVITELDPASASAAVGLRPGDIILQLNQTPVQSAEDCVRLSEQIKGPRTVARVWREGHSQFVVIDENR